MTDPVQPIIEAQKAYYQARALEYDEWFYRRGRYDHGPAHTRQWEAEVAAVQVHLHTANLTGHVLDVAAGTGIWTGELLRTAGHVTAIDSSAEMLEINRRRANSPHVTYIQADLFYWQPVMVYDAIFMGFWLSHVQAAQLFDFVGTMVDALKPGGKIFFVDSLPEATSTAKDMVDELSRVIQHSPPDIEQTVISRRLNDGREFKLFKIFYRPQDLIGRFEPYGINLTVTQTERFFMVGWGTKPA